GARFQCGGGKRAGQTEAAELAILLVWRCPEPGTGTDRNAADGVDDSESADDVTVRVLSRRRTEATLAVDGRRAGAGADAAEGKIRARRCSRRVAQVAIRRKPAPILVATIVEIEHDGGRHDRHARGTDGKTAALFLQPGLHARCGIKAEARSAGKRNGIDALDGLGGIEQRRFARPRGTATQVDRADRRFVEYDGG